jgi:hypothetical protein
MALESQKQQNPGSAVADRTSTGGPARPASKASFSLAQRFGIGVNVAIMVIAAAALLIFVNWIGARHVFHRDVSTFGRYSLSEHMRKTLASIDQPVRLTVLYTSQDPKLVRDPVTGMEYRARLMELAEEMGRSAAKPLTIDNITTPSEKNDFAARIESRRGESAGKYLAVIDQFPQTADGLKVNLAAEQNKLAGLGDRAWLSGFIQRSKFYTWTVAVGKDIEENKQKLGALGGGALPAYD